MLDYTSLFALAAVVREGSFERAARALHVTPSAISQRIRLLEERVGCALVVRGQPRGATASPWAPCAIWPQRARPSWRAILRRGKSWGAAII
jgi:hypothetical protein